MIGMIIGLGADHRFCSVSSLDVKRVWCLCVFPGRKFSVNLFSGLLSWYVFRECLLVLEAWIME